MSSQFDNLVGYANEKKEIRKIANLIKNKEELKTMGGKLPKGLLLLGPNGVGKTKLAEAFIEEANCYTVRIDGAAVSPAVAESVLDEKFEEASKNTPCIIFIDEIDKLAGYTESFFASDNFGVSNYLLHELNRYSNTESIFILGCGNRKLPLEQSLIRSGRIDKTIKLNNPKESERLELLKFYAKNKPLCSDVDFVALSESTDGLSCADIECVLNEATLSAFSDGLKEIPSSYIEDALEIKRFGHVSKDNGLDDDNLRIVASHEVGHAIISMALKHKPIDRLTVLETGEALGYSSRTQSDKEHISLDEKFNDAKIALGGRIAEMHYFNKGYTGCNDDLMNAGFICKALVSFDGYLGIKYLCPDILVPRYGENDLASSYYGNHLMEKIEEQAEILMSKAYEAGKQVFEENIVAADALIELLMQNKVLNRSDLSQFYNEYFC